MHGRAAPELRALAERRYDLAVLCAPDFDFVQDGTRRDKAFRDEQHAWYMAQLQQRRWPWLDAGGCVEQRLRVVVDGLGALGGDPGLRIGAARSGASAESARER